jgi:hypothetical protein
MRVETIAVMANEGLPVWVDARVLAVPESLLPRPGQDRR